MLTVTTEIMGLFPLSVIRAHSGVVPVRRATLGISGKAVSQREPVGMANPTPATLALGALSIEMVSSSVRWINQSFCFLFWVYICQEKWQIHMVAASSKSEWLKRLTIVIIHLCKFWFFSISVLSKSLFNGKLWWFVFTHHGPTLWCAYCHIKTSANWLLNFILYHNT